MRKILLLFFILFCTGCVNPYLKFYTDKTNGADLATMPGVILPSVAPLIYSGTNVRDDEIDMLEKGFMLLGYSSFNGANDDNNNSAVEQGEKVNAEIVLFYKIYTNTINGSYTLTLPDTQTTTTNTSGNVYAGGDVGSYSGSSTSTTYGTKTSEIPYSVARYDYVATYWIRLKPKPFGAYLKDIPSDLTQQIGTNKGALVYAVVKNSPAFMAEVLRGDVIKTINDNEIIDSKDALRVIKIYIGKNISISLLRNGKIIKKRLKLGPPIT